MSEHQLFYKYMSSDTARIVLNNQTLRWSTSSALNDPYDMQFDLRYEINKDVVKSLTIEKLWQAYNEPVPVGNVLGEILRERNKDSPKMSRDKFEYGYNQAIEKSFEVLESQLPQTQNDARELLKNCKIFCFTKTPDNLTLWAYYTESHKGIVLRFRDDPEQGSPYSAAKPINYVDKVPRLFDEELLSDMLLEKRTIDNASLLERHVYTKSVHWSHEQEWRVFFGNGRNRDAPFEDHPFGSFELDAVIFGIKTPEKVRAEIKQIVQRKYSHAELLQAERGNGDFSITFKKI